MVPALPPLTGSGVARPPCVLHVVDDAMARRLGLSWQRKAWVFKMEAWVIGLTQAKTQRMPGLKNFQGWREGFLAGSSFDMAKAWVLLLG